MTTGRDTGQAELKLRLRRTQAQRRLKAFACALPLLVFVLAVFLTPLGMMLFYSVNNPEIAEKLPRTSAALRNWDGDGLPGEEAYSALAEDLLAAQRERSLALIGKRLNYELPGMRSRIMETGSALAQTQGGPYESVLRQIDPVWGDHFTWVVLKRSSRSYTALYLLSALDLRQDLNGRITSAEPSRAIFRDVFLRTFTTSLVVTIGCLLIGYPVAYLLATAPSRVRGVLMILVILPFWTSLLVRTTGWIVMLQTNGVVNKALAALGLVDKPLELAYTRLAVFVAMTHILLPFMILPLYSVMKGISPTYMRAAASLGAGPVNAFVRVYLPQTLPGVGAGSLLVFILAIGYYITPILVGGANDQMISYFVAFYINDQVNWGMASALGTVLLFIVMVLYLFYTRLVGIDRVRLA